MKKKTVEILVCMLLFVSVWSKAETIIPGGDVSGTWGLTGSPYLIDGEIIVPTDSTLQIEPGIEVIFRGHYKMIVRGYLIAIGTDLDSILFTAADTVTGWHGIRFINAPDSSYLVFCIIQYGRASGNAPDSHGGGLFCDWSNPVISNCLIRNNSCGVSGGVHNYGGGICCLYSNPTIRNCTIAQNRTASSWSHGGGICCVNSSPIIINCSIFENTATLRGGGICCYENSNPWINHCSISWNTSGNDAGGINISHADPTIENCIISNNTATEQAGGIYCQSSNSIISYCSISENTANLDGGGILLYNDSTAISNCTISRNSANGGGGISIRYYQPIDNSPVIVVNTIVEGNNGNGVLFLNSPGVEITFCDFANNQDSNFTGSPPADLGQIVTVNANGDSCDQFYNVFLNPLFVDPLAGNYCLQAGSPCIDAGDPNSLLDPDSTIADIGAFYYHLRGDTNGDGIINIADIVYLINYLFINGPSPDPLVTGDVNCDWVVDIADVVYLVNYLFMNGPPASCCPE